MNNYPKVPCPFLQMTDVLILDLPTIYDPLVVVFDFRHTFQYKHPII